MWKFLPCLAAGLLLPSSAATANAPPHIPLTQMIAEAKAIGVGRVAQIKPLTEGPPLSIWRPNKLVTIEIDDSLRGEPQPQIKAGIRSDRWDHPALKVGDRVWLFIANTEELDRGATQPTVDIFAAGQGFVPLNSVPARCRDALRESIVTYRPSPAPSAGSRPIFNNAAIEPFISLLDAEAPAGRRWVAEKVLSHLHLTLYVEKHLTAALDDADIGVQRPAAYALARGRYGWRGKLTEWRAPAGDPVAAKIERVLLAQEILRGLYQGDAEAARIAEILVERSERDADAVSYAFRVTEQGGIALKSPAARDPNDPVVHFVMHRLRHFDWSRIRGLPLTFRLDVWTADKAYLYVDLLSGE